MTDADLIRAVQSGDKAALDTLYRRYLPSVWRYAFARLQGDTAAAEDVVSETFLAAVRRIGRLKPEGGSVAGWLIGIARHKIGDIWRRRRRVHSGGAAEEQAEATPGGVDPASPLVTAETRARVAEVLDTLPDDEHVALEWKYVEKRSVREIARRLGRTEKAAETVLYRARKAFREAYSRGIKAEEVP
ncbi:MAG: sigma-70 family RNA polymerase sigma factor [Phycisphaerae bacterium]